MGTQAIVAAGSLLAGRYRLVEPLPGVGLGGWRARDDLGDREVAARELVPAEAPEAVRQRAVRDATDAASLRHPGIVPVYDVVEHDDAPWAVTELAPEPSLDQLLRGRGPATPVETARIGLRVLEALEAADAAGVRHRDLTPATVLVGDDGQVRVTGFGLTPEPEQPPGRSAAVTGSVDFVAPERARGVSTSGIESDMWSLGATLYAAVEGRLPFHRDAQLATLAAVVTDEPPPPRRAGALRAVIDGLLIKDPAHRLGLADARRMLDAVVRGVPVVPAPRRAPGHSAGPRTAAGPVGATVGPAAVDAAAASRADGPVPRTPTRAAGDTPAAPRADGPVARTPTGATGDTPAAPRADGPVTRTPTGATGDASGAPRADRVPVPRDGGAAPGEAAASRREAEHQSAGRGVPGPGPTAPLPTPSSVEAGAGSSAAGAGSSGTGASNSTAGAGGPGGSGGTAGAGGGRSGGEAGVEEPAPTPDHAQIHDPEVAAALAAFEAALAVPQPARRVETTRTPDAPVPDELTADEPPAAPAEAPPEPHAAPAESALAAPPEAPPERPAAPRSTAAPRERPVAPRSPAAEPPPEAPTPAQSGKSSRETPPERPGSSQPAKVVPPPRAPVPPERPVNGHATRPAPDGRSVIGPAPAAAARNGHPTPTRPAPVRASRPPQPRIEELGGGSASRRRSLLTVIAVVLAVVAAVLIPFLIDRARDDGAAPSADATPSPTVTSPATVSPEPAAPPPAGFVLHRDPSGFSIAVPRGWRLERDGSIVDFRDPTSSRFIRIDQRADPRTEPYDDWIAREPTYKADLPGYDLIRIANVTYRTWPTADWEFTWGARGSERSHVLIRNVVPNEYHGYALYWSTTDDRWKQDLPYFDVFVRTFAPKPGR